MHQTIAIVIFANQSQTLANLVGGSNTFLPKIVRQLPYAKRQDPHRNRTYLIMSYAKRISFTINHLYQLSFLGFSMWIVLVQRDTTNRTREYPRVKTQQRLFFMWLKIYCYHFLVVF